MPGVDFKVLPLKGNTHSRNNVEKYGTKSRVETEIIDGSSVRTVEVLCMTLGCHNEFG